MCKWLWSEPNERKSRLDVIMKRIKNTYDYESQHLHQLREFINKTFIRQYSKYWASARRVRLNFEKNYNDFLSKKLKFVFKDQNSTDLNGSTPPNIEGGRGCPRVKNEECSLRTQQRRVQELRRNHSQDILSKAIIPVQDPTVEEVEMKESVMTENYDNVFYK